MHLRLALDGTELVGLLDHHAPQTNTRFSRIVSERIEAGLHAAVAAQVGGGLRKISVSVTANGTSILEAQGRAGMSVSSIDISMDVDKAVEIASFEFGGLLAPYSETFGYQEAAACNIRIKPMKAWNRHRLRGYSHSLRPQSFSSYSISEPCECRDNWLCLSPQHQTGLLLWDCIACGLSYTCECFKGVREKRAKQYAAGTHRFPSSEFEPARYRPGICHICRGIPSGTEYEAKMYGGSVIRRRYAPYMWAHIVRDDLSPRDAENRVRERLGVPLVGEGWVAETELYRIVKSIFPHEEVVREASPPWLGKQRYDIFVPRLMLAIEYHGQQHFAPVSLFGGSLGFERAKMRDAEKREKSRSAGVTLIEFSYDQQVTPDSVQSTIAAALETAYKRG